MTTQTADPDARDNADSRRPSALVGLVDQFTSSVIRDSTLSWRRFVYYSVLLAIGSVVAYLRYPATSRARMWSEDGNVFLGQALQHPLSETLFTPYAGYGHLVPRLVAWLVTLFPIGSAPAVTSVVMAVATGLLGISVFYLAGAHLRGSVSRLLLLLLVVAAPSAGLEVALSSANFQWYLLIGGFIVIFTRRSGWLGAAVGSIVLVAAVGSSVFALGLFVPLALARAIILRRRSDQAIAIAGVLGGCFQMAVMIHGTRQLPSPPGLWPAINTYVSNVMLNGWIGPAWTRALEAAEINTIAGVLCLGATFTIAFLLRRWSLLAIAAFGVGAAYFAAATILTGYAYVAPAQMIDVGVGSRYFFFPIAMVTIVIIVAVDKLLATRRVLPLIAALALVGLIMTTVFINYRAFDPRAKYLAYLPTWSSELTAARTLCAEDPSAKPYLAGSPRSLVFDRLQVSCDVVE
ncbi:hypothetical protein ACX9R5_15890 [Rathayibacter sp. CAU 1779]